MFCLSRLAGGVFTLAALPVSSIAQQQGRVTRDGGDVDPNGTRLLRQPAVINLQGQWDVENVGVAPDIEVEITPRDAAAGRDPQLERAVQEALRLLAANPVPRMTEPPPPVRSRRPGS